MQLVPGMRSSSYVAEQFAGSAPENPGECSLATSDSEPNGHKLAGDSPRP